MGFRTRRPRKYGHTGSPRKLAEAINRIDAPRIRIFPGNTARAQSVVVGLPNFVLVKKELARRVNLRIVMSWGELGHTAEAHGSPRKLKISQLTLESEYFQEFQRWGFGLPYPTPYVDEPEARGSSRKLKIA